MHRVNKKGIQSLLRRPEQEEPLGGLRSIMEMTVFERNRMGGLDFFVRLKVRVSGGVFCSS
jgi:hypothetical protein